MSKEVGHGWVEAREGSCVGADGGSPEGDRSQRRSRVMTSAAGCT